MSGRTHSRTFPGPATVPTVPVLPQLLTKGEDLRRWVLAARERGQTVGLVPTMGALHEGHLSLVDAARSECHAVVVTIFVNPTQFGPGEDFESYPRDLEADCAVLCERGCQVVFSPSVEEIYPPGHETTIDVGSVARPLEGECRPGHFRGVATVVLKLFQLAPADRAYFGRKDYQQTLVVRQMVDDLNVPIAIRVCPIVREADGLAMSSRNAYLSSEERERALALPRSLRLACELAAAGERDVDILRSKMRESIDATGGVDVQYIAFVADGSVEPVTHVTGPTVAAIAAKVGRTRLIDNATIE